jgi:hypothetical protein
MGMNWDAGFTPVVSGVTGPVGFPGSIAEI